MLVYLTLESPPQFNGNILDVDIGLRNPYLGLNQFTGFDVSGIVFTHGSLAGFNDPDIVMCGEGDTRLLNADGYSRWWNPSEFPHGDSIFGYTDGMLGTPSGSADFNCSINGYKYFADGLEPDDPLTLIDISNRGLFSAGQKNVRHYTIDLSGGLIFNYAIDACWKKPVGSPPYAVPEDFPPAANRSEAWNIAFTEQSNTLYYEESTGVSGGELILQVDVYDHYNADLNHVYGESLDGLPLASALTPVGGGAGYSTYELDFTGGDLTHAGDAELLITVQSEASGYGGLLPGKPVCAYFTHTFDISSGGTPSGGWAKTWGGTSHDWSDSVATCSDGSIFVACSFYATPDFDPGPGVVTHTANGYDDVALSKFNADGELVWVRTWGGTAYDWNRGIAVDDDGNAYVTGGYRLTVDFDPGTGTEMHTSNGEGDIFLSKFDSEGNFAWARTWGSLFYDEGYEVAVDGDGNACVTGNFRGSADFDPGPGTDIHDCIGISDSFLSKFDADGNLTFAHTWGSTNLDEGHGVDFDNSGNTYASGCFCSTIDFDPGPGTDEHTSNGLWDVYLTKLAPSGDHIWTRTWGGNRGDRSTGCKIDDSGYAFVSGEFEMTVDFDPGSGIEELVSMGLQDIFASKFDSNGNFCWARAWGASGSDSANYICPDNEGNVYIVGYFRDTVDFDPGAGVDEYISHGVEDAFISKLDSSGSYLWARIWGGGGEDWAKDIAVDSFGASYTVGDYNLTIDLHPGPEIEEHASNGANDVFFVKLLPNGYWE